MSSISDFRAREEQLRRLDAQLNEKKNAVVQRAEELVRQQADRLHRMDQQQVPTPASYDHHAFSEYDQGFLDETTGYRGRVETAAAPSAAPAATRFGSSSRPVSGVPAPSASAAAQRNYARPVSAATQEGRRRSSAIPQAGASTTATSAQRAPSASRAMPSSASSYSASSYSSSATAAPASAASRPQSRARMSVAPPVDSYSRQSSYDDAAAQDEQQQDDYAEGGNGSYQHEETGGGGGGGDDVGDDAGLDGLELPAGALGSAATIRFQKARLVALAASVTSLTSALAARDKELGDLKLLVKNGNDSREKLLRTKEALEKASAQTAKTLADAQTKFAHTDGEASTLRREVAAGEKRCKEMEAEAKTRDAKLNRALAEVERLKEQMARVKSGGGGGGGAASEETQKELASLRLGNKKLLQQRSDLLVGFKKQHKLIEVLKKQKLHVELAKMLNFTEEEFARTLDMGEI